MGNWVSFFEENFLLNFWRKYDEFETRLFRFSGSNFRNLCRWNSVNTSDRLHFLLGVVWSLENLWPKNVCTVRVASALYFFGGWKEMGYHLMEKSPNWSEMFCLMNWKEMFQVDPKAVKEKKTSRTKGVIEKLQMQTILSSQILIG